MIVLKKILYGFIIIALTSVIFYLSFNYKKTSEPNVYYKVYLEDEVLGVIKSKTELENYIDKQGDSIKEKLGVLNVYAPTGIKIEKIATYDSEVSEVEDIYALIEEKASFTVKGYQFTIRKYSEETEKEIVSYIYTTSEDVFTDAITEFINAYVGEDVYVSFKNNEVVEITTTGSRTENIYIDENITIKEKYISTTEKIYTDSKELSQFLLFGKNIEMKEYTVKAGETIEQIAYNNEISVNELILSNPTFSGENQLVFAGQVVTIGVPDPQLSAVLEEYVVEDQEVQYTTVEVYDETMNMGKTEVRQEGENGIVRVAQRVRTVNGVVTYVDPISKTELKPTVNKVVALGSKYVPSVGSTENWHWPTDSGWVISSGYGWRIDPYTGTRSFHGAIDIAGTGYNSNIYAATNGVVYRNGYTSVNGYYVIINHNNGYYTHYGHMIRKSDLTVGQTVAKGDIIGHVGSTGAATGPHVHFSVWVGIPWRGYTINPLSMY